MEGAQLHRRRLSRARCPRKEPGAGSRSFQPGRCRLHPRGWDEPRQEERALIGDGAGTVAERDRRDAALAQGGDPEAFERLYRANVERIHSLAVRLAGPQTAEDLTQEVFIRAWERLETFRGEALFSTWLHRLAINHVLAARARMRRREARRTNGTGILEDLRGRRQRPDVAVDLERALDTLPERARRVFVLYDMEGYSHREIADLLGITDGTSKSQLHRARMILREHLR